jgi:sigma-B regulation protein RsbU (phosphoserine phosphatase)
VSRGGLAARIADGAASLAAAQEALGAHLEAVGLPLRLVTRAQVIAEEVVLNALRHGGASRVDLHAVAEEGGCTLRFADDGAPFDPVSGELPLRASHLEEPREGGRGLLLLRRFAAALHYTHEGGENRLTLRLEPG